MNKEILKNISWNVFGNLVAKFVAPLIQILVARLLLPEDYGAFGIAMAIMAFFEIIKDAGLTQAIIVNQADNSDIRLQFTVQLVLAIIFYMLVIIITPYISSFYGNSILADILPLLGILLFLNAFIDPVITYYLREQEFKLLAIRQMIMPIIGGIVSLIFAMLGYGVYALVFGTISGYIGVVVFFIFKKTFDYKFYWNNKSFFKLFGLGKEIIIQKFSGYLVGQADSLVIGKKLALSELGFYRMGHKLVNILPIAVVIQIQQVVFSDLAKNTGNSQYYNRRYNQFIVYIGGVMSIYTVCVFLIAPYAVPIILGDKWNEIIPILQILSAGMITGYLCGINNEISKLLGFARIYSIYTIIRSVLTLSGVIIAVQFSLKHLIITWVVLGMTANVINELIFYTSQSIIKVNKQKIFIYIIAWIWLLFSTYIYWYS